MRARTCGVVRRQLSAYQDGELAVEEQIALEAHLRVCVACRTEARDLQLVSGLVRSGAPAARCADLDAFASNVVSRMKAERAESFSGQTQRLFADMHLVWAALGATGATVACVVILFGLFYFGIQERPDSLEAMIANLAPPAGSDQNPLAELNDSLRLPTAVDAAFPEAVLKDQEAVFALAAVVTREGRVKDLNMLDGSDGTAPAALLSQMSKARFEPARRGNNRVAVNMVWLYAQVNVRAKAPEGSRVDPGTRSLISSVRRAAGSQAV